MIEESLSKRINVLRFLLIVLVVSAHNGVNTATFKKINLDVIIPNYLINIQFLMSIINETAVPLSFLFSAYLLYNKGRNYFVTIKTKCKTILLPYFLWHILLIGFYLFISNIHILPENSFTRTNPINWNLLDWAKALLGDYSNIVPPYNRMPFIYAFWFLRDLFILNICFVGIKKLADKLPFGMLVLCFTIWINEIHIYIVSPRSLFFFTLGYYIIKYNLSIKSIDAIRKIDLLVIFGITITLEYCLNSNIAQIIHKINIILGCIALLKLSKYLVSNKTLYNIFVWLQKYQFIVYALHGIVVSQIFKIYAKILPLHGIFLLFEYFLIITSGIVIPLIIGIVFSKLSPKIYKLAIGGRV